MGTLWWEIKRDGQMERWGIKYKRCFNIPSDKIEPRLDRRRGSIRFLVVGRDVKPEEIEDYIKGYLLERGLLEKAVRMRSIT